ncbi:ABC transporter permease [Aestuariivirga litoralis]|uniref:ABC transporter permease n=1 Tax=Aestuariivirga litoralis TaxID=2650924 RepID=UPI0018C731D9|nr:ABC transporter permease [Aestuariivirga litoralis]MBG1233804.1 ABC transporter permease [Aestuariivirga litoralis]
MSDNSTPTKTISDFEAKLEQADKNVASFDTSSLGFMFKLRGFLREYPTSIPAMILLGSLLIFGINATLISPNNFLSANALSTILAQVTVTGIVAIAQTIIILTAGIDLSVGAILVVSSMIMGKFAVEAGVPVLVAVPFGMLFAAAMGWVNGILVTYAKIPPFIVTLGTLNVFNALKLWYTGSQSIRAMDLEEKTPSLLFFGKNINVGFGDGFHVTFNTPPADGDATIILGTIALLLLAVLVWYMLYRTAWGRHVHAIGDDPDAAMLTGIQTRRVLISVYALAGMICGFGAWVAIGRIGSVSPIAFETVNLDSITATVIGGTSLFGGRGSIAGSVIGAVIVGVFTTGLAIAGVDDYWQYFAAGSLVIFAVALDQWLRRASQ